MITITHTIKELCKCTYIQNVCIYKEEWERKRRGKRDDGKVGGRNKANVECKVL